MLIGVSAADYRGATTSVGSHCEGIGETLGLEGDWYRRRSCRNAAADDFGICGTGWRARTADDEVHEVDAQLGTAGVKMINPKQGWSHLFCNT